MTDEKERLGKRLLEGTNLRGDENSLVWTSSPGWKATGVRGTMHPPCRTLLGRSSTRWSRAAREATAR